MKEIRGLGRFRDMSFTPKRGKGKGGKRHHRYYIYIQDAALVENGDFPFTEEDQLLLKIKDGKLIVSKCRVKTVIEEI